MAITAQMRTDVAGLYAALFGRAPEADGLGYWVGQLDAGRTVAQVAQSMYDTAPARVTYPLFLTNEEIVGKFYTNVLGRTADADGLAYWTAKLNAGESKGQLISEMVTAVTHYSGTDATALASQATFNNKVAVGLNYAVDLNGNDVAVASTLLTGVTSDPATVTAAEQLANGTLGTTFNLTVNQDTITGTTSNDKFIAGAAQNGNGDLIDTLQSVDSVDGGAGTDTLYFTQNETHTVAPTLKNIENIVVKFVTSSTLDLVNATGVTSIAVEDSSDSAYFKNVGSVANWSFKNSWLGNGDGAEIKHTAATALHATLDTVGTTGSYAYVDFGSTTGSAATSLTVNANNAWVDIYNDGGSDVLKTVTVTATGDNAVGFDFGSSTITSFTASGSGSLDITDYTLSAVTTVNTSAMTGDFSASLGSLAASATVTTGSGDDTLTIDDIAAAKTLTITTGAGDDSVTTNAQSGTVTASLGDGDDTYTSSNIVAGKTLTVDGGAGDDKVDLTAVSNAAIVAITGGDGNDTVLLGANLDTLDTTSTIDGGAGTNIIGIADGADLTSTTGALLSNFQTLEVKGGTGSYDMSVLSLTNVTQTGGTLSGGVTIHNAAAGTTYTVTSAKATDLTDANVVTYDLKSAAGTSDVALFTLNAKDGDNDGNADGNITLAGITLADDASSKGIETLKIVSNATPDADDPDTDGVDESLGATDYTNTVTTIDGTAHNKVLDVTANANLTITTVTGADLTALATIKVAGAGDFTITNALAAGELLTSVDASASTGGVTIDASANTVAINYKGSAGADTFTAGTAGGVIYTGKGTDSVDLSANSAGTASAADTIVLKAATDSQIADSSKDGKFTIAADSKWDAITGFETAAVASSATLADKLDVSTFGFSAYAKGVVDVTASVIGTTDLKSVADLFADAGGDRGVAFAVIGGTDTYVFIDANHDGNFTAADDLMIELVGVTGLGSGSTDVAF
jgi:hypothetical protein